CPPGHWRSSSRPRHAQCAPLAWRTPLSGNHCSRSCAAKDRSLPANPPDDRPAPHRLGLPSSGHHCRRQAAPRKPGRLHRPRQRPDGSVLTWKTINLADDRNGLIPFFIEWSADSVHPSKDAPARCTLEYFEILSADPDELSSILKRIGLDLPVQRSDKARLHALISGPKGDAKLST